MGFGETSSDEQLSSLLRRVLPSLCLACTPLHTTTTDPAHANLESIVLSA
jgi:hypothetical protein